MAGDPQECRRHARNCIDLADQAVTPEGRLTLINLANHWIKLAAEIESAQAFLEAMKTMEPTSNGRSQQDHAVGPIQVK
jgi:hypothetical protein